MLGSAGNTDRQHAKFVNTSNNAFNQSLTPSMGRGSKSVVANSLADMGGQSSMIDREKRALEKIKARQQKDIEQMMEYELQMERIR